MSPAVRAEPVGAREEVRLEDRLQHQLQGCLDHPVGDRSRSPAGAACRPPWGSSAPAPAAGGNCGPSTRSAARRGTPRPRPGLDGRGGAPVHPGRPGTLVAPHPIPRHQQERGIGDEVEQIIEPAMRIITGPTVQLGLDLQYPTLRLVTGPTPVRRYSPATTSWHSSIRTADLLAPFAMCPALPAPRRSSRSRLLRGLRPDPTAISRRRTCPPTGLAADRHGRPRTVPTFTTSIDRSGRRPALPRQHRHAYAAGLHRGLPTAGATRLRS